LISDGIIVSIDLSDGTPLNSPFQLCIQINEDISQANEYTVLSFGQLNADQTVVVLDTDVTTTSSATVCARVYNGTYFVVARLDDWEDVQPYDELQASLKWVGLALYFVVVIFGVFQLVFVGLNYRSLIRGKQKIVFVSIVLGFNTRKCSTFSNAFYLVNLTHDVQSEACTLPSPSTHSKTSTLFNTFSLNFQHSCSSRSTPSFFISGMCLTRRCFFSHCSC
jgi:hypothetical protein